MKIIDDNEQVERVIERLLNFTDMTAEAKDYTFVNANLCRTPNDRRTSRKGIDEAYNILKKGEKIALYSFENPQFLYSDNCQENKQFMKIMSEQASVFLQLPLLNDELKKELAEPKFYNRAMDLISSAAISNNIAGAILHSAQYVKEHDTASRGKQELGLNGTDEQIIDQLKELRNKETKILYNKIIPGLFVDIEGTLISKLPRINDSVLEK